MRALALSLLVITGCAMHAEVGVLSPHPAISLGHSERTLALAFGSGVPADEFEMDCDGGGTACKLHVTGFRRTLTNAFTAGFAGAYPLAPDHAELTLQLQTLALVFDVDQHLALRYTAELDDREGHAVGRSFGTLPYTQTRASFEASAALRDQLGLLFEKIAADAFPK